MVTVKLLNNSKLSNFMQNKYCVLCVKNCLLKIVEDVDVGILEIVESLHVILSKNTNRFLGWDITTEKMIIFPFTGVLSLI